MPTTPSQTVGPFFAIELPYADGRYAVPEGTRRRGLAARARARRRRRARARRAGGELAGRPQRAVRRRLPRLRALGHRRRGPLGDPHPQAGTGPGRLRRTPQAPHVDLAIFARGLLHQVVTRLYFADEAQANAADPVLAGLDEQARATLVAQRAADGYELDIHLQGPHETTFFAV